MNPREFPTLGHMVCFHNRYNLGDEHQHRSDDYTGWEHMAMCFQKQYNAAVILPLYMLDHSGITIQTHPFYGELGRWDSGQVGYIVVSRADVAEWYGTKYCTKNLITKATQLLQQEVETYNNYLQGGDEDDYDWEDDEYETPISPGPVSPGPIPVFLNINNTRVGLFSSTEVANQYADETYSNMPRKIFSVDLFYVTDYSDG